MPNELLLYVLEHTEVEKFFNQASFNENDSSTVWFKLEIKSLIQSFNMFDFWYMKQVSTE